MAINLADSFQYFGGKPLDSRIKYETTAAMKSVPDANLYDGCLAYCTATNKYYTWLSSNTVDETLGKWREYSGGGGGGTDENAYHKSDEFTTTLNDTSYFPFSYRADASSEANKRSLLFSILKGKLKEYFDTIYDRNNIDIPKYCMGCNTSASTTMKEATNSRGSFVLDRGAKVAVQFNYTNTASDPTLSVHNTTAKEIKIIDTDGEVKTPTTWWAAHDVVNFIYDGTYWLMQPTFSMTGDVPMIGTIDRSDIYSTTEKVVGCWLDGRPIYQKSINFGALPNASTKTVSHNISNLNEIIGLKLTAKSAVGNWFTLNFADPTATENAIYCNVNSTSIKVGTGKDYSGVSTSYATLQYTKTTDAANSYSYANENDYSSSERIVGSWIDGRKVYQKTITLSSSQLVSKIVISHGISNFSKLVEATGWVDVSDDNYTGSIPLFCKYNVSNDSVQCDSSIRFRQTDFVFGITSTQVTPKNAYITIKYLKTT